MRVQLKRESGLEEKGVVSVIVVCVEVKRIKDKKGEKRKKVGIQIFDVSFIQ